MPHLAVIALGSNLGDRLAHLQQARDALQTIALPGTWLQSGIYQTAPVACPDDSPDFYNAVVSFSFDGSAGELHAFTRKLEQTLGRERSITNAPRTIDLDLLLFGDEIITSPDLQIPHPRLHLRRFVLEPLAEIHPDQQHPTEYAQITTLLGGLSTGEPALEMVKQAW